MRKLKRNNEAYILAKPYKQLFDGIITPQVLDTGEEVYEQGRFYYAAIVLLLKIMNASIVESTNDDSTIIDNLVDIKNFANLDHIPTIDSNDDHDDIVFCKLLKAIYFLILATENGSNISELLLDHLSEFGDKESISTYRKEKEYLDTMFDAYTGFGDPVCREITNSITNLIEFVKKSSKEISNG